MTARLWLLGWLTAGAAAAAEWSDVVARAASGIVAIEAVTRPWDPSLAGWLEGFGGTAPRASTPPATSRAAGVVLRPGQVATVLHAVSGSERIEVRDATGGLHAASVTAVAADRDLAWLTVETLTSVPLPTSSGQVGQAVLSAGFPTHDGLVVSEGILSGQAQRRVGSTAVRRWWLTDALIRPGYSGGPLLDAGGAVVGLAVGGHDRGSGAEGLGLALPIEDVLATPTALPTPAAARGPADVAWERTAEGLKASAVGPVADALGLAVGDVVVAVDGKPPDLKDLGRHASLATLTSGRVVVLAAVR